MIYYILGLIFGSQILIYHTILKKRKPYTSCVNYSSEDPKDGFIVMWSIGDIWINYEQLRTFQLTSKGLKRYWKLIGTSFVKVERKFD